MSNVLLFAMPKIEPPPECAAAAGDFSHLAMVLSHAAIQGQRPFGELERAIGIAECKADLRHQVDRQRVFPRLL